MQLLANNRRAITFLLGALIFGAGVYALRAEDEPKADDTKESPFTVPATDDADKLLEFIEDVRAMRPARPRGPAEYRAARKYENEAPGAITTAAQKILDKADKKSTAYADASYYLLESKVIGFADADDEAKAAMVTTVKEHMEKYGVRRDEASVAYGLSQALEQEDKKLAAKAYEQFAVLIKASDDKEIRDLAKLFEAPARRLGLVGSKMEVFGKTLAGEEIDWESYRGKVVLIDFWATWCGPCLAEVPNLKVAYKQYHDKGFEIVGVNLDERQAAVKQYLEKNPLPWTQLHQEEAGNDLSDHYGVSAIPFIVLVDKDGTVVTTDARGPKLQQNLEKLLGPAKEAEEAEPVEEAEPAEEASE